MSNNINIILIAALFWMPIAIFIFLKTFYRDRRGQSFDPTDPETMVDKPEPLNASKFTEQCTLLSKECRGDDLWIIFVDENAELHEELQSPNCNVCIERS